MALLLAAGCALEVDYGGTAYACDVDGECPPGFACRVGRCVPAESGAPPPDADPPPPVADAAAPADPDAGCGAPCPRPSTVVSFALAPGMLVIPHDLGRTPAFAIFFSTRAAGGGLVAPVGVSFGLCDAERRCRAVGFAGSDGASPTRTARGHADAAIYLVEHGLAGPLARGSATLTAWDESSLSLFVDDLGDAAPGDVHVLIVGGDGVSARLARWTMPTAPGPVVIGGMGFAPTGLLTLHAGHGVTSAPPYLTLDAAIGLGAADAAGGAWALAGSSIHGEQPALTRRALRAGACLVAVHANLSITKLATCTDFGADGFRAEFSAANGYASRAATLAVSGLPVRAGCVARGPGPTQAVDGLGFRPAALFFAGVQAPAGALVRDELRLGLGLASAGGSAALAFSDADGASPARTHALAAGDRAYHELEGAPPASAVATLAALDADGFTLAWAPAGDLPGELCYVAFGAPAP